MGDLGSIPGLGRSPGGGEGSPFQYSWASLMSQLVKNLPAMWKTSVWSLGWEDPPGEGKGYPLQYSGLENSMDCIVSPWGRIESDTTEGLSLSLFSVLSIFMVGWKINTWRLMSKVS